MTANFPESRTEPSLYDANKLINISSFSLPSQQILSRIFSLILCLAVGIKQRVAVES